VFVHRSIIEKFAKTLQVTQEKTFVYGSVWNPKVNFGPLYATKGIEKVKRHVEDAVTKGAKLVSGGFIKEDLGPNFYVPTIILESKPRTMQFGNEETFGPVAPLVAFDTEEEVLEMANTYESGLAAYFYTENISRLWRVSESLETGMVGVQVGLVSACEQPFGGIKESGIGREGSRFGVEDYVNIKSITVGL
jgi:succinate-semialdehyde dehydrogenase/glutarate-semialdehyde dehydrogenase